MSEGAHIKFEAIQTSQLQPAGAGMQMKQVDTAELSEKAMDHALATIEQIAGRVEQSFQNLHGPNEIDVALSLTVRAGGDIWVANLSTEGTIGVTMVWKRD